MDVDNLEYGNAAPWGARMSKIVSISLIYDHRNWTNGGGTFHKFPRVHSVSVLHAIFGHFLVAPGYSTRSLHNFERPPGKREREREHNNILKCS